MKNCPNPRCRDGKGEDRVLNGVHYVVCLVCGMTGPVAHSNDAAQSYWNTLPRIPERVKQRAIAKEFVELKRQGFTLQYIADLYLLSVSTIWRRIQEYEEE